MKKLLLSLVLCACGTQTEYVSSEGLELYSCGTQLCLEVKINGQNTSCVEDSGARGTLWVSREVAADNNLQALWCYDSPNSFGTGTVEVCMLQAVQACWQVEGEEHCEEVYPYATQINVADCLFGL